MAMGIKTIETIQHKFPKTVLVMLFQTLILRHFESPALFLLQITSPLLLSLEKQMNWAFRSSIQGSFDLRIQKNVLGFRQRIELKSLTYFFQYINKRKAFVDRIKLPTANFRLNHRSSQIILLGKVPSVSSSFKSFFHHVSLKWNSLPLSMRDTSVSLQVFRSRLKNFLLNESNAVPIHLANTWRDFRFK